MENRLQKKPFYTELSYVFGMISLAFATALMEAADFGVSMVVAPAYIIYLKVSQYLPFFTFGMAEYMLQGVLLVVMTLVLRRFRISYLFSFVTAVLYGMTLDLSMFVVSFVPCEQIWVRVVFYILGMLGCSNGVSLFFHTYISPEAYELFVKEISRKFKINIHKFKTCYDCVSCLVGVVLSFAFFGLWHFEGVKAGTVLCALINGFLISRFTHFYDRRFSFCDKFRLRRYFVDKDAEQKIKNQS